MACGLASLAAAFSVNTSDLLSFGDQAFQKGFEVSDCNCCLVRPASARTESGCIARSWFNLRLSCHLENQTRMIPVIGRVRCLYALFFRGSGSAQMRLSVRLILWRARSMMMAVKRRLHLPGRSYPLSTPKMKCCSSIQCVSFADEAPCAVCLR